MATIATGATPERANPVMFVAAVVFAALAAVLVFVALQNRGDEASPSAVATTTEVVVVTLNVSANVALTDDMVEVRSIPSEAALDNAFSTVAPVIGLPARFPMARGEQVTPLKVGLDAIQDEDDLALVLPDGTRGFAVEVSEVTGVGGLLLPGNNVDVIAVFDERQTGIDKAVTLLQNITVISVAQEAQQPVPAIAEGDADGLTDAGLVARRPDDVERQPGARTVTLAVTPVQVQALALAQENGEIWLALRPLEDNTINFLDETNLEPYRSPAREGN